MRTLSARAGAFVMIASALPATSGAAQVVFENFDGVFQFVPQTAPFLSSQGWLDITQDKFQGPGAPDFQKITLLAQPAMTGLQFTRFSLLGNANSFVAGGGDPLTAYTGDQFIGFTAQQLATPKSFGFGSMIGGSESYQSALALSVVNPAGAPSASGRFALTDAIVGLSVILGGQTHFGFVALRPTTGDGGAPLYQPIAWGYESAPGVPFNVIPSPGAGALAFLGFTARRRRPAR